MLWNLIGRFHLNWVFICVLIIRKAEVALSPASHHCPFFFSPWVTYQSNACAKICFLICWICNYFLWAFYIFFSLSTSVFSLACSADQSCNPITPTITCLYPFTVKRKKKKMLQFKVSWTCISISFGSLQFPQHFEMEGRCSWEGKKTTSLEKIICLKCMVKKTQPSQKA